MRKALWSLYILRFFLGVFASCSHGRKPTLSLAVGAMRPSAAFTMWRLPFSTMLLALCAARPKPGNPDFPLAWILGEAPRFRSSRTSTAERTAQEVTSRIARALRNMGRSILHKPRFVKKDGCGSISRFLPLVWKRFHIVKRNKTTTVEKDMKTLCHVVRDSERWISESFWAKVDDTMAHLNLRGFAESPAEDRNCHAGGSLVHNFVMFSLKATCVKLRMTSFVSSSRSQAIS